MGATRRKGAERCKGQRIYFDLLKENGAEHRHYLCVDYNDCLTGAAHDDWRSFSCKKCTTFLEYQEELAAEKEEVVLVEVHEIWQAAINIGGKD